MAVRYHRDGFLLLRQAIPEDLVDRVRQGVEPLYERADIASARRVQDAWNEGAGSVRELAVYQPVQDILSVLYERRPIPFQTLDFKWGSEQRGHSDSIHFSCLPARYMCGVWVALEDTDDRNGPLFYYPGSHRLPEITAYDLGQTVDSPHYHLYEEYQDELMRELRIEPVEFHAHKGDALIWSSNVIHGGMPAKDAGRTRWSQVTHYYFEGCIYYTPIYSDIPTGELLLKSIIDLNTMLPVKHTYNGDRLSILTGPNGRSRLSRISVSTTGGATSNGDAPPDVYAALVDAQAEVAALRRSASFRLGNAVIRPASALRNRLRSWAPPKG